MKLGTAIHSVRKKLKMSQKEFSDLIGIDQSYLSMVENHKKRPSTKLLEKISEKTEIPLPVLLFYSISEEDVKDEKKELFNLIYPRINEMLAQLFEVRLKNSV